jgi:hypothetical protein
MPDACEQMELPLFSPRSFEEILAEKNMGDVSVIFNPRMKNSWRMKIHSFSGRRTLNLPAYFEHAPQEIKEALVEWVMLFPKKRLRKTPDFLKRKKSLERPVLEYIATSGNVRRRSRKITPENCNPRGLVYDLQEVFGSLNAAYFKGALSSYLRWNKNRGRSYQSTFSDIHGKKQNLISIAQMYNRPDVPRFAVESIMFHEMLHIAIPPYKRNYRNIIHGREFKRVERLFPHYHQWRTWEKEHFR